MLITFFERCLFVCSFPPKNACASFFQVEGPDMKIQTKLYSVNEKFLCYNLKGFHTNMLFKSRPYFTIDILAYTYQSLFHSLISNYILVKDFCDR